MSQTVHNLLKKIMLTGVAVMLVICWGAVGRAESLDAKNLTAAPVWYQPHLLGSVAEAAHTLNNFRSFFSDWAGGEIQELNVDRSGVRLVAVLAWTNTSSHWVPTYGGFFLGSTYVPYSSGYYQTTQTPQSSETRIVIPAAEITQVKVLQFPYLERENKWGVDLKLTNGSNLTLRAKNAETAERVADALATLAVANGCKLAPEIGIITATINTATEFTRLKWAEGKGVLVSAVFPDSPAAQAGLTRDDIIVAVNGQNIADPIGLIGKLNTVVAGQPEAQVELQVFRAGQTVSLPLTVKNYYYSGAKLTVSAQPAAPPTAPLSLGIAARNLTAEEAQQAGLAARAGIFINSVDSGSVAEQMGMKPGDYLLELNGKQVADLIDLKQLLAAIALIQDLKIFRNGSIIVLGGVNKF